MKKINRNKLLSLLMRMSGSLMAFAIVAANLSQTSTCWCVFHQPKVPKSLLDIDV